MTNLNEILNAASSLPASDKFRLISELWETVTPDDWASPSPEWIREVQRRSADFDTDQSSKSTWSEVRASARKQAGYNG